MAVFAGPDPFTVAVDTALGSYTGPNGETYTHFYGGVAATVLAASGMVGGATTEEGWTSSGSAASAGEVDVSADYKRGGSDNSRAGYLIAFDSIASNYYLGGCRVSTSPLWRLSSYIGGSYTDLTSQISATWASGATKTVNLIVTGGTVELFIDSVSVFGGPVSNSDIAPDQAGFRFRTYTGGGFLLDSYTAQDPSGGSIALSIANADSSSTADGVPITQTHQLAAANAESASAADSVAISQTHQLAIDGAASQSSAGAPAIGQTHVLDIVAAEAASTADAIIITQEHILAIASAAAASFADSVALGQAGSLSIADAVAPSAADAPSITQHHQLGIAGAVAASSADAPAIGQTHVLSAAAADAQSFADAVAIAQRYLLSIADAVATSFADSVSLGGVGLGLVNDTSLVSKTVRRTLVGQGVQRELESRTPKRRIQTI